MYELYVLCCVYPNICVFACYARVHAVDSDDEEVGPCVADGDPFEEFTYSPLVPKRVIGVAELKLLNK